MAVPDLHCCLQDFSSSLQHVGSLVGMWDLFLDQGLNWGLLLWEHGVPATEPPVKSPHPSFLKIAA